MLTSDASPIAFRSDAPLLIEWGTDTVAVLRPARAGTAITPTSATFTLTDPSGSVVISAASATCADGMASYTVLGTTTSDLDLSEGWVATWSVVLPGETVPRNVRCEAHLVRVRLYPVISDQDIFRRVPNLDPNVQAGVTRKTTDFSGYLDDAWSTIQDRLIAKGDRPWLIMSSQALREVHLTLTLVRIFEDFASRLNAGYSEQAQVYRDQYRDAWNDLRFTYDRSNTGRGGVGRKSPGGSTWLGGRMR